MRTAGTLLLLLLVPALSLASELININTADATLLDTLPGIGPTYAERIIEYRTTHGPFASISDIQNVSGIGPSTYAQIAPLITVGPTPSAPVQTDSASSTPPSRGATYVPPPTELTLAVTGSPHAYLNVPYQASAVVRAKGAADPTAQITWSFGDGSFGTGTETAKVYRFPGTYLITVTATDGQAKARGELIVDVRNIAMHIASVSGDGITIANDGDDRLDLSGWRILSGTGMFRVPDGTILLPRTSILFPYAVTNLPFSLEAAITYPDGAIAMRFPADAKPEPAAAGSYLVQTAAEEPLQVAPAEEREHISISGSAHDQITPGSAPAAATGLAAAGASLPADTRPEEPKKGLPGLLRSPWTLSFLGIMALAGGAFILL